MPNIQHVFFRVDPSSTPKWTFYATPVSIVGGGSTLSEAREAAQEALRFALETNDLPEIREYTEREAVPGAWIRTALDEHRIDRQEAFDVLQGALRTAPEGAFDAVAATGDVIIVPCEPTDTLGFVSDQMTRYDALWVALNDPEYIHWIALHGDQADVDDSDGPSLGELGFGRDSLLVEALSAVQSSSERHALVCV